MCLAIGYFQNNITTISWHDAWMDCCLTYTAFFIVDHSAEHHGSRMGTIIRTVDSKLLAGGSFEHGISAYEIAVGLTGSRWLHWLSVCPSSCPSGPPWRLGLLDQRDIIWNAFMRGITGWLFIVFFRLAELGSFRGTRGTCLAWGRVVTAATFAVAAIKGLTWSFHYSTAGLRGTFFP